MHGCVGYRSCDRVLACWYVCVLTCLCVGALACPCVGALACSEWWSTVRQGGRRKIPDCKISSCSFLFVGCLVFVTSLSLGNIHTSLHSATKLPFCARVCVRACVSYTTDGNPDLPPKGNDFRQRRLMLGVQWGAEFFPYLTVNAITVKGSSVEMPTWRRILTPHLRICRSRLNFLLSTVRQDGRLGCLVFEGLGFPSFALGTN